MNASFSANEGRGYAWHNDCRDLQVWEKVKIVVAAGDVDAQAEFNPVIEV
ncbi:MAG: hypothetical protein HC821_00150 [Lewinella sp.]|nr:hypothetical protein [Lewinella sp.]